MAKTATADTPKLIASTTNAGPGPNRPTTMPPRAGPNSDTVMRRSTPKSALACGSTRVGRRSGTIAVLAGKKKALAVPLMAATTVICHSCSWPVIDR